MKKPIALSSAVDTNQIAVEGAAYRQHEHVRMRLEHTVEERCGEPKKRIGIAMPANVTAPRTSTSLTTLAQAVPRRPALKTKSARIDEGDANRCRRVVGAVAGEMQHDLQAAELQCDVGDDHDELKYRNADAERAAVVAQLRRNRATSAGCVFADSPDRRR